METPSPESPSPSAPRPRNQLARSGVDVAELWVSASDQEPSSLDGTVYNHATLSLRAHGPADDRLARKTLLALTFQRHRLDRGSPAIWREPFLPSPRFDVGPLSWSAFYGPRLDMRPGAHEHRQLMAAAKLMKRLDLHPHRSRCELTRYVEVLEQLGVPVEIRHILRPGLVVPEEALGTAQMERGVAGRMAAGG